MTRVFGPCVVVKWGSKDGLLEVGRLGSGPKAAVTRTLGGAEAVCWDGMQKAVACAQRTEMEGGHHRIKARLRFKFTFTFRVFTFRFTATCKQFKCRYRSSWTQFKCGCRDTESVDRLKQKYRTEKDTRTAARTCDGRFNQMSQCINFCLVEVRHWHAP